MENENRTENIELAASLLTDAKRILFITGAGVSAESGIPTYRGIGGIYAENEGITEEGIPIEKALSIQMFWTHPKTCWKYISTVEKACRGAHFNRAHEIIGKIGGIVLTQNVDGFHIDAGSKDVIEIHGNIHNLSCTKCGWTEHRENYEGMELPPSCPECAALVRPDVVLFEENLPMEEADRLYAEMIAGFDVVVSVGTSALFTHIWAPIVVAGRRGTPTIDINPGESEISELVDISLKMEAVAAFEAIWEKMQE